MAPIVSDVISDDKLRLLVNLAKVYSCESLADETDADPGSAPKTIEDLMSATYRISDSQQEMNGENFKFF